MTNNENIFELKQEHVMLMEKLSFSCCINPYGSWDDRFIPEINPKRPFGNGGNISTACEILGYEADENGDFSEQDYRKAEEYPIELPVALEIMMKNHTFEPGLYQVNACGAYFYYQLAKRYMALKEPLDRIYYQIYSESSEEEWCRMSDLCETLPYDNAADNVRYIIRIIEKINGSFWKSAKEIFEMFLKNTES